MQVTAIDRLCPRSDRVSANVTEGVVEKLGTYFPSYRSGKPQSAYRALHFDPRHHGATPRVVRSRVRRTWEGANIFPLGEEHDNERQTTAQETV